MLIWQALERNMSNSFSSYNYNTTTTTMQNTATTFCAHGFPPLAPSHIPTTTTTSKYPDKRRQHARLAARTRRSAEAGLFQDLGQALPISPVVLKSLDKLALLRIAVCYVKLRKVLNHLNLPPMHGQYDESLLLESVGLDAEVDAVLGEGFLLVMAGNGDIIYVSDNVARCLGCEKFMIIGTNINDHIHKSDHHDMDLLLSMKNMPRVIEINGIRRRQQEQEPMVQTTTTTNIKTSRKSVTVLLRSKQMLHLTGKVFSTASPNTEHFFIGMGETLAHPLDNEFPFPHFKIVTELDWVCTTDIKFLRGDPRSEYFLGYRCSDLVGVSAFELLYPSDGPCAGIGFKKLFVKGHHQTGACYRLLIKNGGWAWFLSRMSIVKVEQKKEDGTMELVTFCVGRHFMLSEVQDHGQIFAPIQRAGGREAVCPPKSVVHHYPEESLVHSPEQEQLEEPISDEYLDELMALIGEDSDLLDQLDALSDKGSSSAGSPLDSCNCCPSVANPPESKLENWESAPAPPVAKRYWNERLIGE